MLSGCNCCEFTTCEVIELVYEVYNTFVDKHSLFSTFEQKKTKLLNLYQDKICPCIDRCFAHNFEVSKCGCFEFLMFVATIRGNAINLVVYHDGCDYVVLNQGGCRMRYDACCRRVGESVAERDLIRYPSKVEGKKCEDNCCGKTYCYDKKCDKAVSSHKKMDKKSFVKILNGKKCECVEKKLCIAFETINFDFCNGNQAVVFIDGSEYIRLQEEIPVVLHFKSCGKKEIKIKLFDACHGKYVAETCLEVKVHDSSSSSSSCDSSSSSCDSSSSSSSSCDSSSSSSCSCDSSSSSSSCKPCKPCKDKQVRKVTAYKNDDTTDTTTSTTEDHE